MARIFLSSEDDCCYRLSETLKRSQALRDDALKFLSDSDRCLGFTASMIQAARDKVVAALLQGRKQALEWRDQNLFRLDAARKEKEQMKSEYMGLHNAIHDNNRPLMLAETRMAIRAQKPNTDQETDESNRTYDIADFFPSTVKLNCLLMRSTSE